MSTSATAKSRSSAEAQAVFRWTFPGAPIRIDVPIDLISRLRAELSQRVSSGCPEVGGVLLGRRITSTTLEINACRWVFSGEPGTRFRLDPSAVERLREEHLARNEDILRSEVVGCFRTQAEDDLQLRDDEMRLVREHFQNPTDVVLLIRTSDKRFTSGFLFWMNEDAFAPFSFMDFPLDAGLLQAKASGPAAAQPLVEEGAEWSLAAVTEQDAAALSESVHGAGTERTSTLDENVSANVQHQTQLADATPPGTVVGLMRELAHISVRKAVSAAAVVALLAAGLSAFLLLGRMSGVPKPKAPATVAPFPFQLSVEARGDELNLRWNPQGAPIIQARDGRLTILDGDQLPPRIISLNLQQLMSGHIYYRSSAERVQFQLEIVDLSGRISKESVMALSSSSATIAPRSSPQQASNPQVATRPIQRIPILSANRGAPPRVIPTEAVLKGQPVRRAFIPPPPNRDRTPPQQTITVEPPTTQTMTAPPGAAVLAAAFGSSLPTSVPPAPQAKEAPVRKQIAVANLQLADPIKRVMPAYPPTARELRIQGTVRFTATIGKDGSVKNLEFISGNPALVKAATDAVKQWLYRPTLLNGVPTEMTTQIDLNFSLK